MYIPASEMAKATVIKPLYHGMKVTREEYLDLKEKGSWEKEETGQLESNILPRFKINKEKIWPE